MNSPSIKTIKSKLDLNHKTAKKIKSIFTGEANLEDYKSVRELISACYHPPGYIYKSMTALNELVEGYGLEYIEEKSAEYVNMGDTYINTIIMHQNRFKICSWGDLIE